MPKLFIFLGVLLFAASCQPTSTKDEKAKTEGNSTFRLFSRAVNDSFSISVNLPDGYDKEQKQTYPVAYLLDANFTFEMLASVVNKYTEAGLLPPIILVGIGYTDMAVLDSLRSRDYTYPVAIPEYEMSLSGGADKFLDFISNELIPMMDRDYRIDTTKRVLSGHSLGGYFVSYALLQHLSGTANEFQGFIAASPSFNYNHYYLLDRFKELPSQQSTERKATVYMTYGGLEDEEEEEDPSLIQNTVLVERLDKHIGEKQAGRLVYRSDIYSGLEHMDTPVPTFVRGLQWVLDK